MEFEIGSLESRAAARSHLEARIRSRRRREVFFVGALCPIDELRVDEWLETEEGVLTRSVFVPEGMSLLEGLQKIGGYSPEQLAMAARENCAHGILSWEL